MPLTLTAFFLHATVKIEGDERMVKYACDMENDSPCREISRELKKIQTAQFIGLTASVSLLLVAWIARSKMALLVWMVYCMSVFLVFEILKGKIYRKLYVREQEGWKAFSATLRETLQQAFQDGDEEEWDLKRLGFAYKSDEERFDPVLCYFGRRGIYEIGPVLKKHFVAYVANRMVYAYEFLEQEDDIKIRLYDRDEICWESLAERHQKYLCQEAQKRNRYLVVENFIYDMALCNMQKQRANQPCNTVTALSRMKKEPVYRTGAGEAVLTVSAGTMRRVGEVC